MDIVKKILATSLVMLLVLSIGCSEKYDPQPYTYSQLLTGTTKKTWRVTTVQLLEKNAQPVDFKLPTCFLNDTYVFSADAEKTFEYAHATLCDTSDRSFTIKDSWTLVNANATLNFPFILPLYLSPNLISFNFTLKSVTKTAMIIEFYDPEDDFSYRFTFASSGE